MPTFGSWLLLATALVIAGCERTDKSSVSRSPSIGPPVILADTKIIKGQSICPLEVINGQPIRLAHALRTGITATFVGWSTVADGPNPVPPDVYLLFRSTVPDGSADLFWPGMRVARPDLSMDARRLDAGYSANGKLSLRPGIYKVMLWTGDTHLMHECDTRQVLQITQ